MSFILSLKFDNIYYFPELFECFLFLHEYHFRLLFYIERFRLIKKKIHPFLYFDQIY